MSNKPSKMKKIKSWQFGNFIISIQGKTLQTLQVKTTAGHWSETFRSDTDFFRLIEECLNNLDDNTRKYLHNLFSMHYLTSFGIKDNQFISDVTTAYTEMVDRMKEEREVSDEENQNIINQEKEKHNDGTTRN